MIQDKKLIFQFISKFCKEDGYPFRETDGEKLAEFISNELSRIFELQKSIYNSEQELRRLKIEYEKSVDEVQKGIGRIRMSCGHEVFEHHRSGVDSADNYTECKICGYTQGGHYDINKRKKVHGV